MISPVKFCIENTPRYDGVFVFAKTEIGGQPYLANALDFTERTEEDLPPSPFMILDRGSAHRRIVVVWSAPERWDG